MLKLRGDISLMFGLVLDAWNYFQKALVIYQLERKINTKMADKIKATLGAVNESLIATVYYKIRKQIIESKEGLSENQRHNLTLANRIYKETIALYDDESRRMLLFELHIKMLGLYSLIKNRTAFLETFGRLRVTVAQIKTEIDPRFFLYIGDLALAIGLRRLAVAALFECARQARKVKNLEQVAQECLSMCARVMRVDIESYSNNFELLDQLPSRVSFILLVNLLDLNINNRNTERTLHYYLLLLKKFCSKENLWVFEDITDKILWEYPFYRHQYDALPFVQRVVPLERRKEFKAIGEPAHLRNQNNQETLFIYDPRPRCRQVDLSWVAQEEAEVMVHLTNPLPIEVQIDSLSLECVGVDIASYSAELTLPPSTRNLQFRLKLRPVSSGVLEISGIRIRIGNLIYINSLDQRGVSDIYRYVKRDNPFVFEQHYVKSDVNIRQIPVAESVPILDIELRNYVSETLFYNENFQLDFRINNYSKRDARQLAIGLSIVYENSTPLSEHFALPVKTLPVNKSVEVAVVIN